MDSECEEWLLSNLPDFFDMFVKNKFRDLQSLKMITERQLELMGLDSFGDKNFVLAKLTKLTTRRSTPSQMAANKPKLLQTCKYFTPLIACTRFNSS